MIRLVLAVLLAVALAAASLPAVQYAGEERSEAQTRAAVADIDAAATDLARSEEVAPGTPGARRVVTVDLPARGVGRAPVHSLRIAPANLSYSYRVGGRRPKTVHGTEPTYAADGTPIELSDAGRHRLRLRLVEVGGDRRVVVDRFDATAGAGSAVGADPANASIVACPD